MAGLNTGQQKVSETSVTWIERNSFYRAIGDILLNHWDPLGQSDSELPHNQYDSYISMVYNFALKSDCKEKLIKYLNALARDGFGMETNDHNDRRAAQLILAVRDFYFANEVLLGEKDVINLPAKYPR